MHTHVHMCTSPSIKSPALITVPHLVTQHPHDDIFLTANVTGVMVSTINATSIQVSWLAVQLPPDGNLTWYTVYYCSLPKTSKRESGGYTNQTFPPNTTSGVINNLSPNDNYQFSVVAQVTIRGQLYSGVIPLSRSTIIPG